jgi:hypothetical protein
MQLWRVFPWDKQAMVGAPFSASFVPRASGAGRFDLYGEYSPVLYLAESPSHAIAEILQGWRGRRLVRDDLRRGGLPLALVAVTLTDRLVDQLVDLCSPQVLATLDVAPDRIASYHRSTTQPIAHSLWEQGFSGLRWWSTFWGDWHSTVVFTRRAYNQMAAGDPEILSLDSQALQEVADLLSIEVG